MSKTAILAVRIISDTKGAVNGMNEAGAAADGFGAKLGGITPGALAVGGAVITGVVAAGKALYNLGATFDEVEDTIRTGTGATGDALEGLIDTAHAVATNIPTDFETAGSTVADLNTRMGLSGDTLQTVASQYLEASRILGETVDINTTTGAFNAFKIEGEAVSGAMDDLFRVSQATGVGMNDLAGSAQKNAGALQEMGFTFTDSIALIGGLDKAGVDADATLNAMRKGLVSMAEPGQSMGDAFFEVTDKINGFIAAGDMAAATDLASSVFGTKGATQMVQALQTGLINAEDLTGAIGATGDTILGVGADTMDAAEKWQILKNRGMEALEPLASAVFGFVGDALGGILDWVDTLDLSAAQAAFTAFAPVLSSAGEGFAGLGAKIGPLISTIQDSLVPVIAYLAPIVSNAVTTITGILNGALDVVMGVFTVIKGLFTGDWSLIWDGVRQVVDGAIQMVGSLLTGMKEHVSAIFSGAVGIIRNLWSQAWEWVKSAVSNGVANVRNIVAELPGKVTSALGNAGTLLLQTGKDMIQGMINGIGSMGSAIWDAAKNIASNAVNSIKDFLGIHSPSRVLRAIGVNAGEGLVLGINDQASAVTKAWDNMLDLPDATPRLRLQGAGPLQRPAASQTINITVNGALDPVAVAEQIRRILAADARRTGAVVMGVGR